MPITKTMTPTHGGKLILTPSMIAPTIGAPDSTASLASGLVIFNNYSSVNWATAFVFVANDLHTRSIEANRDELVLVLMSGLVNIV